MKRKIILIILVFAFNIVWVNAITLTNSLASEYNIVIKTTKKANLNNTSVMKELDVMLRTDLSYENEDATVIGKKINNFLKKEMQGKGEVIAKYAIASEENPYLVAALIIEATECDTECTFLVKKCNNVGKLKYNKDNENEMACYGGFYQQFSSINDSIKSYVKYVKNNYYDQDLTTASSIAKATKKDVRWIFLVNEYINKIKNSTVES